VETEWSLTIQFWRKGLLDIIFVRGRLGSLAVVANAHNGLRRALRGG
jgi:hypothetical protein